MIQTQDLIKTWFQFSMQMIKRSACHWKTNPGAKWRVCRPYLYIGRKAWEIYTPMFMILSYPGLQNPALMEFPFKSSQAVRYPVHPPGKSWLLLKIPSKPGFAKPEVMTQYHKHGISPCLYTDVQVWTANSPFCSPGFCFPMTNRYFIICKNWNHVFMDPGSVSCVSRINP